MNYTNTLIITGAGISVDSGIQPFRGKDGVWEENPMTMATYAKFYTDPLCFLSWYYNRFKSCLNAEPNETHKILATQNIKVITQNVDGLHRKANHNAENLIEIHGCLNEKRIVNATQRSEIVNANWNNVDDSRLKESLFELFRIPKNGIINEINSFRPHVLLFDEIYSDLYEIEKALNWVLESEIIIFMGTSNSVGITQGILEMSLLKKKQIIVVDPEPDESFKNYNIRIIKEKSTDFCKEYLK